MSELYKQAKIKYEHGSFESCWIPSKVAKLHKRIIDEDTKLIATIIEVYDSILLNREQIEINRNFPLRRVTDI